MQKRFGILALKICCLALGPGACNRSTTEAEPLPEKLRLPVMEAETLRDKFGAMKVAVTTTDRFGRSAGQKGYLGSSRDGQCRVYLDGTKSVTSNELYAEAFDNLDRYVRRVGGIEAIKANPDKLTPTAHFWADVDVPWRCVASALYYLDASGYPVVGFMVNPVDPIATDSVPVEMQAVHIDLPSPTPPETEPRKNKILLTHENLVLWKGETVTLSRLRSLLKQAQTLEPRPGLELTAEADARYDFVVEVLNIVGKSGTHEVDLVDWYNDGFRKYISFGKDQSGVDPTRRAN